MTRWLGIDIGGAHLKVADGQGFAETYVFPLWQRHKDLVQELRTTIAGSPHTDHVAACMTGELADCFATKADGVRFILESFVAAVDYRHARVYCNDGRLVTPQVAIDNPHWASASNWHALARFAGRYAKSGPALVIDAGSTTCDVVPLMGGSPANKAVTDTDRMIAGELVYSGVVRTPVCAVADAITYRGQPCPLAHEMFATMRDVYLTLGELPESSSTHYTADGRPATREAAQARLARSICLDRTQFGADDATAMAQELAAAQVQMVAKAINQTAASLGQTPKTAIISGQGEFLARRALEKLRWQCSVVSLREQLGDGASACAPAHALATIAGESSSSRG